MSASHRLGARGEQRTAEILRTERVRNRPRFVSAPDCVPIRTDDGSVIVPESKVRKLPQWLLGAVAQARKYVPGPGVVPLVVIREKGSREPMAVLPLVDLARLIGVRAPKAGEQLSLLLGGGRAE